MTPAAEKFGFLPGFGWIATQWTSYGPLNSLITVAICWLIAPGSVWATQYFVEGKPVSLRAEDNFASFYPGDLYLGAMTGLIIGLGMAALPLQAAWYTNTRLHSCVLAVCVAGSFVLTWSDVRAARKDHGAEYSLWQILTPSKLVHNLGLYGPYAYLVFMAILAVASGIPWNLLTRTSFITAMLLGSIWLMLCVKDSTLAQQLRLDRFVGAGKTKEEMARLTMPVAWRPIFMGARKRGRHRASHRRASRS